MEFDIDKIWEELETLETMTPKRDEHCNYTFGDWRYSYLMYVPFVDLKARDENFINTERRSK